MPKYTLLGIPQGAPGVRATLKLMSKITGQYKTSRPIRELALQLVSRLPEKNWKREAEEILRFVQTQIRYVKDVRGVETIQTPVQTLRLGQGDCDDKSTLAASLLEAIGHPTRFKAVGFAPKKYSHVYVQTKIGTRWVTLEGTQQDWELGRECRGIKQVMIHHN